MLNRNQAEAILERLSPHCLSPGDIHPVTAIHWHIPEYDLNALGLDETDLKGIHGYDGSETHWKGKVHVFDRPEFEDFTNTLTLTPGTNVYVVGMPGRTKDREI